MNKEKFLEDFNKKRIKGIENLSDYPTKEQTLNELQNDIKPENIKQAAEKFFNNDKSQ